MPAKHLFRLPAIMLFALIAGCASSTAPNDLNDDGEQPDVWPPFSLNSQIEIRWVVNEKPFTEITVVVDSLTTRFNEAGDVIAGLMLASSSDKQIIVRNDFSVRNELSPFRVTHIRLIDESCRSDQTTSTLEWSGRLAWRRNGDGDGEINRTVICGDGRIVSFTDPRQGSFTASVR